MSADTHVGELLEPIGEALDRARLALALVAGVVLLVVAGAKLERFLMKRQLAVIDGDVAKGEAGGGRS